MRLNSILAFILISGISFGQNPWKSVDENSILNKSNSEREIIPDRYSSFSLDFKMMSKSLLKAQKESFKQKTKGVQMDLPMPDGSLERFTFRESSCMSPVLSAKFPEIKSYRGISETNPHLQARVDFGTMGFHAVIYSEKGRIFIDPYFSTPDEHYISYFTKDHHPAEDQKPLACGVDSHYIQSEAEKTSHTTPKSYYKSFGTPVTKRTYRMAIATTGEWGALFGTVEGVMSGIVTAVNRLNMIYENEISVKFELIDDNDQLIFLDGTTDPYVEPSLGTSLLGQNRTVLNNIVGSQAYDIGHVFTIRCTDVGGVANPGVVCMANKANGVSCVGTRNISAFMVDTGAHEIGHQFSGGHSWNNCPGILEQKSENTAYEPGSGSTILSYAGTCGNQNITSTNDDYFHVGNLSQFISFIENSARCADEELTDNHTPDITLDIPSGLTIPIATPFELDGSATDEDGDALTYNWEQMDTGPTSRLGAPEGNAPSFRSYPPSTETYRSFPRLPFILGGIGSNLEVLPLESRDLTFRFTVRDNHPGAGITVWEELKFEASDSAGPFRVTSQNSITFVEVGDTIDIEWDVANTDNDIINCQAVDIYLSLDNGDSFDIILAENVPNDGIESVVIPNRLTNEGKVKVKARDNVFFQYNRSNIVIREPSAPGFYIDVESNEYDVCVPDIVEIGINGTSFQAFDAPINLEVLDALPEGAEFSFENEQIASDGSTALIVDLSNVSKTQSFSFTIEGTAENATPISQLITFNVTGTSFDDLELLSPLNGVSDLNQTPTFEWSAAENADSYTVLISSNPKFESGNTIEEPFLPDTSFLPSVILDNSSLYYWKVVSHNKCASTDSEINTFGTVSLDCKNYSAEDLPTNISFSGSVEVDGTARVFDTGVVADINVTNIRGQHADAFELKGTLISPDGTHAVMFDNVCFGGTDFNIGFDSESPIDFECPLSSGKIVKPDTDDLSIFKGKDIDGEWIFRINDTQSGDGGQFTSFDLEICASFAIENPFVVNNEILDVPVGQSARINSPELLVDDADNFPEELLFTVVVNSEKGSLYLNGNLITVGDQFTQEQLNNGELRYVHEGTENETDAFTFTVIDGNGGWLDLTTFNINIDENILSSNNNLLEVNNFEVYPNPTQDHLIIKDLSVDKKEWHIQLYSIEGRLIISDQMQDRKQLSLSNLSEGIYILKIANESGSISQRVSVVK